MTVASCPAAVEPVPASAGVRVPPPLIYAVGFGCGVALQLVLHLPAAAGSAVYAAGAALCAAGGGLAIWSVGLFRRAGTHLDPSRPAAVLVTSGPYRLTRNPIYTGFAFLYLGLALLAGVTGALVTLAPLLIAVDRYVIRREERYLGARFGRAYDHYRASVRRWL